VDSPAKQIQIVLELSPVISRYQYYGRVVAISTSVSTQKLRSFNCGLVSCEVAVDHKEVNARQDGICNKPFQAVGGVGEVAVFIEVKITGVTES